MSKEIYRSFEGKLGVDERNGYIIFEMNNFYEIEFLSVFSQGAVKIRVPKDIIDDFGAASQIIGLVRFVKDGDIDNSQYFYNNKWYSSDTIRKIQKKNQSMRWEDFA